MGKHGRPKPACPNERDSVNHAEPKCTPHGHDATPQVHATEACGTNQECQHFGFHNPLQSRNEVSANSQFFGKADADGKK